MEEGGCECHVRREVMRWCSVSKRYERACVFRFFLSEMFIFRARTRPNLHSTLQFSCLTLCDCSPLHDSPRATSLTIRSSHLASEDPPLSRSHSNNLPARPDHRPSVFLEGERDRKILYTHCFSPAPHLCPDEEEEGCNLHTVEGSTFLLRRLLDLISEDSFHPHSVLSSPSRLRYGRNSRASCAKTDGHSSRIPPSASSSFESTEYAAMDSMERIREGVCRRYI